MPVTELLKRNAADHGDEVALVELNPGMEETRKISFKEYDLVQQTRSTKYYRRQITWQVFDEKSNRVANMPSQFLLTSGIHPTRSHTARTSLRYRFSSSVPSS